MIRFSGSLKNQATKNTKPSFRDDRSYKQVVQAKEVEEVEVPTDVDLERGVNLAYIGYFKEGFSM